MKESKEACQQSKGFDVTASCRECGRSCDIYTENRSAISRKREAIQELARTCPKKPLRLYHLAELPENVRIVVVNRDGRRLEGFLIKNQLHTIHGIPSETCRVVIEYIKDEEFKNPPRGFSVQKLCDRMLVLGFPTKRTAVAALNQQQWKDTEPHA